MGSWHLSDFEVISAKQRSESQSKSENSFSLLTQSTEASHTPGRHPFGYEDVAVVVETGVVRVDEFAADPLLGIVAHAFHCLGDALDVFAKLNDDFVLFVKQSHARVALKNKQKMRVISIEKSLSFGAGTLVWGTAQNHPCEVPTWGFSVVLGGPGLEIWPSGQICFLLGQTVAVPSCLSIILGFCSFAG